MIKGMIRDKAIMKILKRIFIDDLKLKKNLFFAFLISECEFLLRLAGADEF